MCHRHTTMSRQMVQMCHTTEGDWKKKWHLQSILLKIRNREDTVRRHCQKSRSEVTVRRHCQKTLSEDTVRSHCQKTLSEDTVRRHGQKTLSEVTVRSHCQKTLSEDTVRRHGQKTLSEVTVRRHCQKTLSEVPEKGTGATDTCVHHGKVKMPHCLTVTHSFLKSQMKAARWGRHMRKEHSEWHLNFMRWLVAGSMLLRWKRHCAFNEDSYSLWLQ